ncbi:MAG: glycosyltransferase [Eubacterium sp.]|nr:glycosyltransferase [Eubacterium sp.]
MLSDFDLEGKNKFQKCVYYLKNYGAVYTVKKALRKLGFPVCQESEYMAWCRRNALSRRQRRELRDNSILYWCPVEVVSGKDEKTSRAVWQNQISLVSTYRQIKKGQDLSDLLGELKIELYVFCSDAVKLQPEFLYEVTKAAQGDKTEGTKVDLIYTDEDSCLGKKRFRPFFKPDASMQMLLNFPYLGGCFAVRRSLLEEIVRSGVKVKLDEDGWYDLSVQAFRLAKRICHIPKVLFSNIVTEETMDMFVRSKNEVNADCLNNYLKSENVAAGIIKSDVPGFYHLKYELRKEPLVSIIIPNKDHAEDLQLCLKSLDERSNYRNYEVIIAENNSEDPATFAYYEKLQEEDPRVRVVIWDKEFNYSAINNFAAGYAKGDLLLFLNNDTEFINEDSLRELVLSVLKPGVGACGAMLYYADETIQHAGVIIGMGGFAAHALWSLTDRDEQYYPFSLCEREVSAVTGACLMVRRQVFEEVGGMEEEFVVALNDVDFCMKVRAAGYLILFNPYAKLYHYESKSRGYEDTEEKQARFRNEIEHFQKKWKREIESGDPYYNPNLTLHRADYSMDI